MPIIETSDYLCALLTFIPFFYGFPPVLIRFLSVFIRFSIRIVGLPIPLFLKAYYCGVPHFLHNKLRNLLHTTRDGCKWLCIRWICWCSVSVVWMLALHGFKLLIISLIRRFSVVCNSILYFCVCYDAVIAWAWLQTKVCPTSEWNSVCFVLFLGKADYCRRKDKKLPQRGQFCAYMRHKVIEDSVISSIITIWKPVCLLFFNLFLYCLRVRAHVRPMCACI